MAKRRAKTPIRRKKPVPKAKTKAKKRPVAKRTVKKAPRRPAKRLAKRPSKKPRKQVETLRTPPSSLDLSRVSSAARSGRKAQDENLRRHAGMTELTGGDVDADIESGYFSGDEVPGGDNLTPDQQDVDETGRALGVQYQDNQELQGGEEVAERDKHRWENE